ncbi:MAG: sensor histidine kinase [Salinigranum sp.]
MNQDRDPRQAQWLLDHFARTDPDVLWMFTPDWDELLFGDEAYEEMWGRSLDDLVANPTDFLDGVHPADREEVVAAMDRLSNEASVELECRIVSEDWTDPHHVWIEGKPVYDDDGEFVAVAGVVRDVTERERYRQQLERTNERLEAFTSFLSHDLRNHLQVAIGRLQLAQAEHGSEHLDVVERALDRMNELTDDVLELGRLDGDALEYEPVALAALAEDCWDGVEAEGAKLVVDDDATLRVAGTQFHNVFENLFRNAIEHTDGPVTVRVGTLSDRRGVYVEDDGSGIPPEDREVVFEFGHSTGGTGLGLALVREIVEAHGGAVRAVESDGGARFEITGVELA